MRKLMLIILALLLLAVPCQARSFYGQFWRGPAISALRYGARGVIIPCPEGDTVMDNQLLLQANSKAGFISWRLATELNGRMSPQEIAAKLGSTADFFLLSSSKDMPAIDEYFEASTKSYLNSDWGETEITITDNTGKIRQQYTVRDYDNSWNSTAELPASQITYCPSFTSFTLYAANGQEILRTTLSSYGASYEESEKSNAERLFGQVLPLAINKEYGKLDRQSVRHTEWVDPSFSLKGQSQITVALPQVLDSFVSDLPNFPYIFQQSALTELQEKKRLTVTSQEGSPLRLEIQVQQYNISYSRKEPWLSVNERTSTEYDYRRHRGDNYQDTFKHIRHWTEVSPEAGELHFQYNISVTLRLVETATGRMVYSYNGTAHDADRLIESYASIIRDFGKRLEKRVR